MPAPYVIVAAAVVAIVTSSRFEGSAPELQFVFVFQDPLPAGFHVTLAIFLPRNETTGTLRRNISQHKGKSILKVIIPRGCGKISVMRGDAGGGVLPRRMANGRAMTTATSGARPAAAGPRGQRQHAAKSGVAMARRRADAAIGVLDQSGFGQGGGFKALNLLTATVNKKAREGDMLSAAESERIVGFETGSVGGDDPELRRSGEF